jgi:quinol monooxygenase YgiN
MSEKSFTPAELDDGFVVAIKIDAKAGEEETVAQALRALIKPTMAEPGVKLFLPYRSPTDRKTFFVFELYRNEAGWAEHQMTDHRSSRRCCRALQGANVSHSCPSVRTHRQFTEPRRGFKVRSGCAP